MYRDFSSLLVLTIFAGELIVLVRAILRPQREPASRIAWLVAILVLPIFGAILYLLIGEARISQRRRARFAEIESLLPRPAGDDATAKQLAQSPHAAPFALASSVNLLQPTAGNAAILASDNRAAIAGIIADIAGARETVHVCFYIWLADESGLAVMQALIDAARRGVKVRVLADALGSRGFCRSPYWQELLEAGVDARTALPVGGVVWTLIRGRVDLRNHRKLVIVDNRVVWIGSQNCADPEFRIKPRYAPWVDLMTRWEGPVAQHCQLLFVTDWMAEHGDDISALLTREAAPPTAGSPGIPAQVIGTGPIQPYPAMTACFSELIHSARTELLIATPYFVPDEQLLFALTSAARRGVRTVLVHPQNNDSRIVDAVSQSHYPALLAAGVAIYEFRLGLLHAKIMVVDGAVGLLGSANLDRRSSELNFENSLLFSDPVLSAQIKMRFETYLAASNRITAHHVAQFGPLARLWQNLMAMLSPLL